MEILGWIKKKDNSKTVMNHVDKYLDIPENLQKDLAVMGIPEDFWRKQKISQLTEACTENDYRWEVLCTLAKRWGEHNSEIEEEIYEISVKALEKVFHFSDERLREYVGQYLDRLNDDSSMGFWTYDSRKRKFKVIPYGKWYTGRYPDSLFKKSVRIILDEQEPLAADGDDSAYRWRTQELEQDGHGTKKCYILTYRDGIVSSFNSAGNSQYFVVKGDTVDLSDEGLRKVVQGETSKKPAKAEQKKTTAVKKTIPEKKHEPKAQQVKTRYSLFSNCGSLVEQLEQDIKRMNIPESFLQKSSRLPMSFGYDAIKQEYFAFEPQDRGNGMIPLFTGKSPEAFRWFILEYIARWWGSDYELEHRENLEKEWKKKYDTEYDCRKAIFETKIRVLLNVYDVECDRMRQYIMQQESYLRRRGNTASEFNWTYDKTKQVFVAEKMENYRNGMEECRKFQMRTSIFFVLDSIYYERAHYIAIDKENGQPYEVYTKVVGHSGNSFCSTCVEAFEKPVRPMSYKEVLVMMEKKYPDIVSKFEGINEKNWREYQSIVREQIYRVR